MSNYPAFSSFRELMTKWENFTIKEEKSQSKKKDKIKSVLDGQSLIMFFKKGNSVFGAPEESRIVFARMKNPTDELAPDSDANFSGFDLAQALIGNEAENLFSANDLPDLEVITRDQAEDHLMKCPDAEVPAKLEVEPITALGTKGINLKDKV
jgi:hypothetical protein